MSNRAITDKELTVTRTLPAAGANNNSSAIDLGSVTLGAACEGVEAHVVVPALPALVDTKKLTVTIQDSADNSSFATLAQCATHVQTGAGGVGSAALTTKYKLPPTTRRYIRINCAVEAAGGDSTGVTATFRVVN